MSVVSDFFFLRYAAMLICENLRRQRETVPQYFRQSRKAESIATRLVYLLLHAKVSVVGVSLLISKLRRLFESRLYLGDKSFRKSSTGRGSMYRVRQRHHGCVYLATM